VWQKSSPSGTLRRNIRATSTGLFSRSANFHVQFVFQFVSRDHHGRNGDRAIIFPSVCQITGSAGSTSRVFA
jgi:hypothetical protein